VTLERDFFVEPCEPDAQLTTRCEGMRAFPLESGDGAFVSALRPVVEALGGVLLRAEDAEQFDVPVVWEGDVVGAVRPAGLHGALDRLLSRVSEELGAPLAELSREDKQRAVQLLDERGAFNFRKSVEDAAAALHVSRFTVYNYLSRISVTRLRAESSDAGTSASPPRGAPAASGAPAAAVGQS
jgi:hypothetical protein